MKLTTQIFHLRINSRTKVRVMIFKDKSLMRKFGEIMCENGWKNNRESFCARAFLHRVKSGASALVIFCEEMVGVGIVAHEMTHCAVNHLQLIGDMPTRSFTIKETDEKLAHLIDKLCVQFWQKYYRKKRK